MSEQDPILRLREKAKKNAKKALELAQEAGTQDTAEVLEKKPTFTEAAVEALAGSTGVPVERAKEIANEVVQAQGPAVRVEAFRAENEIRDELLRLYAEEVRRMQRCPVKIKKENGKFEQCGRRIRTIQQALAHHTMHLMYSADYRVQRQVVNDISEKLFPTEIRGVSAVLGPEERSAALSNPAIRDRLLGRGDD